MVKKTVSLLLTMIFALSLIGCAAKKSELSKEKMDLCESLAKAAVSLEVNTNYGLAPGITIENISANEIQGSVYVRTEFTATGSYTVMDDSGEMYSGTFKVKGYSEGHGDGWDSCEITPPRNGLKVLPETIPESAPESSETTAVETIVLELHSDIMINLSNQYISDGYKVDVFDPSGEFEQCYGAKEAFRAYASGKLAYVYLYDSKEEAENAEFMMYRNTEGTVNGGAEANTYFIHDKVLVAEFVK